MQTLKISIETPCQADWNAMNPTAQGRFCLLCEKEVVDFTHKTDEEVLDFFKNYKTTPCVRIESNRVNRPVAATKPQYVWRWQRPVFAAFVFASFTLATSSCMMGSPYRPNFGNMEIQRQDSIEAVKKDSIQRLRIKKKMMGAANVHKK